MTDLLRELARLGQIARAETLLERGVARADLVSALASGLVSRPRRGWIASPLADRDQLRAIAIGGRLGCSTALRRFGVWAGVDRSLHVHVPRTASRLAAGAPIPHTRVMGVWHPSVADRTRQGRTVRLASDAAPRVHWGREIAPDLALGWIVSPQTALASALRCMPSEQASAAIDSVLHERVLGRRDVDAVIAALPSPCSSLVDGFTGRPESGVESLFVRRVSAAGFDVRPQVQLPGHGRYDGVIDGCVLFEVDGRGHHSGSEEFFADRDRSLVGLALGVPVIRPSARHVLEAWPTTLAAVARTVEDARLVRRVRGLPPAFE